MLVWALIMGPLATFLLVLGFDLNLLQAVALGIFIGGLFGGIAMLEED